MSAHYRQHVRGQGDSKEGEPANKKQKAGGTEPPKVQGDPNEGEQATEVGEQATEVKLCKSIANALMTRDMKQVFLLEGDRHFWPGNTDVEWTEMFWPPKKPTPKKPKEDVPSWVPFQVYTVQDTLTFLDVEYDKETMTRHILTHMVSKGWVPKCCFDNREEPRNVNSVPVEKLEELHSILREFTERVAAHHYRELVMGAIDSGPTDDPDIILATMYKETEEEAGISKGDLEGKVSFLDWGDKYTSRRDGTTTYAAIYVTKFDTQDEMSRIWAMADAERRPPGFNGWRCPHAWYKEIPDINTVAAAREKAIQETRNGAWYSVDAAMTLMDKKNKTMLQKILDKKNKTMLQKILE